MQRGRWFNVRVSEDNTATESHRRSQGNCCPCSLFAAVNEGTIERLLSREWWTVCLDAPDHSGSSSARFTGLTG